MCALKTLAMTLVVLASSHGAARAMIDLPREFATCAGRYSAMMEHAWLMQAPEAAEYARLRAAFLALVDAVDDGPGGVTINRRVEAKAAQAELLRMATFGTEPGRATWAWR